MYNNIPSSGTNPLAVPYNNAYEKPLALETNTFNLMRGFFEGKGFDKTAAEILSTTFIRQAANDGYNPMEVLSTLKGLEATKLNSVVIEILNFNRYKTSYLGNNTGSRTSKPIARNIVA